MSGRRAVRVFRSLLAFALGAGGCVSPDATTNLSADQVATNGTDPAQSSRSVDATALVVTTKSEQRTMRGARVQRTSPSEMELRLSPEPVDCGATIPTGDEVTLWLERVTGTENWTVGMGFYKEGGAGPSTLRLEQPDTGDFLRGSVELDLQFKEDPKNGFRVMGSFVAKVCRGPRPTTTGTAFTR